MSELWEAIKGLGAVVGIMTGLFVLWDRFYKMSPVAVVTTHADEDGWVKTTHLRVWNPSDRPILISWRNGAPGNLRIAIDHSIQNIVTAAVGGAQTIVVESGQQKDLLLLKPEGYNAIDRENRVEAELFWRYAQPKIWQRDRRIRVSIPKASLMIMDPDYFD